MKKYFVIILLFFLIISILLIKRTSNPPTIKVLPQKPDNKLLNLIEEINENTKKIDSVYYKKVKIKVLKNLFFKAKASFYFKQKRNIRIIIDGFTGKQMDIGSNEEIFWFWSKHLDPPYYYYSNHKNVGKTGLKTALHPQWLLESMGFKQIEFKDVLVIENQGHQGIKKSNLDFSGEKVSIVTVLDSMEKVVCARYLLDDKDEIIASVEYKNFFILNGIKLPKQLKVNWFQENIFMEWFIDEIEINNKIKESIWQMPECKKIDLSSSS